ncbi:hypothetical protein ABBQ32_009589 [Trebouxia sp. C0010 RCD-2024]
MRVHASRPPHTTSMLLGGRRAYCQLRCLPRTGGNQPRHGQSTTRTYKQSSRQAWLQQLSPCALQPGQPEREALVSADLQRLQAALVWELNHQYVNVKGKQQHFSTFASTTLSQLQDQLPMPLQKSACPKLSKRESWLVAP